MTAYTACKRSAVKPDQRIALPAGGGGFGHFAVQYAKAMGMRVIAVDGGDEKRDLCKRLGIEAFIDFSHDQGHHGRNYENYHIQRARGANNSCNEGRVCDGAEFLASGWDHGSSRIDEGSDSLGGRSAINVVLEKAEYRWQCSVVGVDPTPDRDGMVVLMGGLWNCGVLT